MTFVDVGANKGDFSLLAARAMGDNGVVIAIEPAPGNCEWLERSVKANGYKCIEVLPNALSDSEGEAELFLAELSGWHSLVKSPRKQLTGSVVVKTRTLDDVIAERGLPSIDMLKVDVEGGEVAVLAGATETLTAPGRRLVLLDLHPPMVDPATICDGLRDRGYEICRIHPSLPPLKHVDYHTTEVAAIKRDG
jgi:FkbM family methyltransferase